MSRGDRHMRALPATARIVLLVLIGTVVALGATITIAGVWIALGGRALLEFAIWLGVSAALALAIGLFLLVVVDRAADGTYTTRIAISGMLTVGVFAITAAIPFWRHLQVIDERKPMWLVLGFASMVSGIFAIAAAWIDARPLKTLATRTTDIARGHFEARLPETGNLEIEQTAIAINLLASRAQSAAIRQSNHDRARESLLLAIVADAQIPIDSIRNITQSMSGAGGEPIVTRRHLEALNREATNLQYRLDEVEEIARLESGQVTLRMQPVSLAQMIVAVCDKLQPGASTRDVIIGPRVDFSAPRVLADPEQTFRALEALIGYALSETPDGSQLAVEMRESGQFVQVAAIEQPGEEPIDVAERIRWESAHRRRESALSLAVAGRLIEIQGGNFHISRGHPGTPMVIVALPRS
jgi:signal transduction histidine kinase